MGQSDSPSIRADCVSSSRGFLPEHDPVRSFDVEERSGPIESYLEALDRHGRELPAHIEDGTVRSIHRDLEEPPAGLFDELSRRETVRVCQIAAFLASAYVHHLGSDPVEQLPERIAVPLYRSAKRLGRQPVLSYDLLCLHNFRRLNPAEPISLDNIDTIQEFTTLEDERWFIKIHVAIEALAGPALTGCVHAQRAVERDDPAAVRERLETISESLERQTAIMGRMSERNDPEVFATEYRPYYQGFDGIVYEGVPELGGEPQTYRGGSGAQSSILPSLDAALGIDHASTEMIDKLLDMREYMPPDHRSFIDTLDERADIRAYAVGHDDEALRAAFNRCVEELHHFRQVHLNQVMQYIREITGETTGTGGTDYDRFLGLMTRETGEQNI
jgi:indoleamine 2,3-dioxygenase